MEPLKNRYLLNQIYISNFKPFSPCSPLKNIKFYDEKTTDTVQYTILSGPNGYGKTTIFQAIEFSLTGKIQIFEFKDKNKKYNEHILVNEIYKESIVVSEFMNSLTREYVSIVRYNSNVNPCTEVDCREEYKDFKLYIMEDKFNYENFKQYLKNQDILPKNNYELTKIFSESSMQEWIDAKYIKQEQSSNLLYNNNSDRVNFLNSFIEGSINEYIEPFNDRLDTVTKEISNIKMEIEEMVKEDLKKEESSIGEQPKNNVVFKEENISPVWDKAEYNEEENFEQYLILIKSLIKYVENFECYSTYNIIDKIKNFENRRSDIYKIILYVFFYNDVEKYIEKHEKYRYLLNVKAKNILEISIDNEKVPSDILEKIKIAKEHKTIIEDISTEETKLYTAMGDTRKQVLDNKDISEELFNDNCPLCGAEYEKGALYKCILLYNNTFKDIEKLLNKNIVLSNKQLENEIQEINNDLDILINKYVTEKNIYDYFIEIKNNKDKICLLKEELEELLNMKIVDFIKEIELNDKLINSKVDEVIEIINKYLISQNQKWKSNMFDEVYENEVQIGNSKYIEYIKKCNINKFIKLLKNKYVYIEWRKIKYEYNYLSMQKQKLLNKSTELKKKMIYKRKLEKICKTIKDAKKGYISDLIKHIEIPLYIYSGKLLQTHQNGLGVFCNTGASNENFTQFKLTTTGDNSSHDVINKFSSGQKAVLNIALILAFTKIKKSQLDIFMIDDPCQSLDDINIASLAEILCKEFDKTQIIMSTHDPENAGFMCYKYYKTNKTYQNFNVQNNLYLTTKN